MKKFWLIFCAWMLLCSFSCADAIVLLGAEPYTDARLSELGKTFSVICEGDSSVNLEDIPAHPKVDIVLLYLKTVRQAAAQGLIEQLDDVLRAADYDPDNWIPAAKWVTEDAWGVPFCYLADFYDCNEPLAKEVSLNLPDYPYTWADIADACEQSKLKDAPDICLMWANPSLPAAMINFMSVQFARTGGLHFDDPAFRDIMPAFKRLYKGGYCVPYDKLGDRREILTPSVHPETPTLLPTMGEWTAVVADFYALCLLKSAPHKDEAKDFLICYAREETQTLVPKSHTDKLLLTDHRKYQVSGYFAPPFDETLRRYIVQNLVPRFTNEKMIRTVNQEKMVNRYLDDEISLDELIVQLQALWDGISS